MSTSNVLTGAPLNTAATPPTTKYSRLMPSQRFEDREYPVRLHSYFAPGARNPRTLPVVPVAPPVSKTTSTGSTSHPPRRCLQASSLRPTARIPDSQFKLFPNAISALLAVRYTRNREGKTAPAWLDLRMLTIVHLPRQSPTGQLHGR